MFLMELLSTPEISIETLVTSPVGKLCSYYIHEPKQVNLEKEAASQGIKVFRPSNVNALKFIKELYSLEVDYFIIVNYQQIFKEELLSIPCYGTINFHPSPLPRYAGLDPFFWMAKNGEKAGGVSAIMVNTIIDGGPLVAQMPIAMSGKETALEIRNLHLEKSMELLRVVLRKLIDGKLDVVQQYLSQRTYYGKVNDMDYFIDWNSDMDTVLRVIRAGYRYPGAFTLSPTGEKIVILSAFAQEFIPEIFQGCKPGALYSGGEGILISTKNGCIKVNSISINGEEVEFTSLEQVPSLKGMFLPVLNSNLMTGQVEFVAAQAKSAFVD